MSEAVHGGVDTTRGTPGRVEVDCFASADDEVYLEAFCEEASTCVILTADEARYLGTLLLRAAAAGTVTLNE